jgi:outer membrane protein
MKNLVKSIAFVVLTVGTITVSNAQKIAHISLDSLITTMAESKAAQEVAQKYLKDLEAQVATMDQELQTKYADYMKNKDSYSPLVASTKENELQDLNKRIEDFKASAQQDYQRKYGELSKPIYDKAKKAIDLVAKENGYKYVLDTSTGNVLYTEAADDILGLVKKKLETMPAATIPGATKAVPNGAPKPGGTTKPTGK